MVHATLESRVGRYWNNNALRLLYQKTLRLLLYCIRIFCCVNKAEHYIRSVSWVNIITANISTLSVNKNILVSVSFLMLCTQSYSITLWYLAIFHDILHMWYYWLVKMSAISLLQGPNFPILTIYWNIAQPYRLLYFCQEKVALEFGVLLCLYAHSLHPLHFLRGQAPLNPL